MDKENNVEVVVRCRPMIKREVEAGHGRVVKVNKDKGEIVVTKPESEWSDNPVSRTFTFNTVYDENSQQQELYDETIHDIVQSVIEGYNGTVIAYGQKGAGKTYTIQGVTDESDNRGLMNRTFEHIFNYISHAENEHYIVHASYLDIYMEEITDLLSKDFTKKYDIKENPETGVYVKDQLSFVTKNVTEMEHAFRTGHENRLKKDTFMSRASARAYSIFTITIECCKMDGDGEYHTRVGRLNLVDFAGSERISKPQAQGNVLKEARSLYCSITCLRNIITVMSDGNNIIPYRDSKLTRLLQESLGGNAKTVWIANIGPSSYNHDETVSTLRFASHAKNIKNKAKVNWDPKNSLMKECKEEIARLKSHLETVLNNKIQNEEHTQESDSGDFRCDKEAKLALESKIQTLESKILKGKGSLQTLAES
ncbi:kinesin-like protein KIF3B isoform X2 [Mytilus californianus]|uniref:kinesin-like protein KIF3B isoform X2 n=1 Tax=Mytilus californianus TaxID=6549 RepID=UPI002248735C|nr:kinesin-like protein KIF3B isoform X2 [Mytilus californianus]